MNFSKNKYLILAVIAGVILIGGALLLILGHNNPKQNNQGIAGTNPTGTSQNLPQYQYNDNTSNTKPNTPANVVQTFYTWYLSYNNNPLSSGAYKTNPYLTDVFKQHITNMYYPSLNNDPVICKIHRATDVTYEETLNTGTHAQVIIRDNALSGQPIHRVVLVNQNGLWLIDDFNCIP